MLAKTLKGESDVSASIAVINESTVVTDPQVQSWVPALQSQVTDHFATVWGTGAGLTFVPALTLANPAAAILPGGYIGMWTPNSGWTQVTGQARKADPFAVPQRGSRRERRARWPDWINSLPYDQIRARRR